MCPVQTVTYVSGWAKSFHIKALPRIQTQGSFGAYFGLEKPIVVPRMQKVGGFG
jgi:hypothetical protein